MFTAKLDELLTLVEVSRSFIWFTFAKAVGALQGQGKDLSLPPVVGLNKEIIGFIITLAKRFLIFSRLLSSRT